MRVLIDSTNVTTANAAVQLRTTDSASRVIYFKATIRAGSGGPASVGNSSTVTAADIGYQLASASDSPSSVSLTFPLRGDATTGVGVSQFWMNSSTTVAQLDHVMVVVP